MIGNLVISASAGSGKTFELTNRLIRLMALEVPPERILALTFSRKAAGEITDTLVRRLAEAAAGTPAGRHLGTQVGLPELDRHAAVRLLRHLLDRLHLVRIGTLDSFFVSVVRVFPLELGVPGEFTILESARLASEKEAVFRAVLNPARREPADATSRQAFLEAFKRATFGREEKRLRDLLHEFTEPYHGLLLAAPEARLWGDEQTIWPAGCEWLAGPSVDPGPQAEAVQAALSRLSLTAAQQRKWDECLAVVRAFETHSALPSETSLLWKLLEVAADLGRRPVEITLFREFAIDEELGRSVRALLRHVLGHVLRARLESTRGLYDLLTLYEQAYDRLLRQRGLLTFADIAYLLSCSRTRGPSAAGRDAALLADRRLEVDYRLDGTFDHWAIDEFQDTSRQQWEVVRNLVDEIVQDPSGRRSFFAVGDVKQAIYGWRGGDASLLDEVRATYGLPSRRLTTSWRSCPAVVEAVNRVFGRLGQVRGLPRDVVARWQGLWGDHVSAHPRQAGYAALHEVGSPEPDVKPGLEHRIAFAARLLQRIEPWRRGLEAAVLVRSNDRGRAVADGLRECGIPTAWEGGLIIADNPVVVGFLSLLRVAEHPGDSFAWQHLLMTPWGPLFGGDTAAARQAVARRVLRTVHERGFAGAIEAWRDLLVARCPLDPFSAGRVDELLTAAVSFDATGNRSCLDFVAFAEAYATRDVPPAGTVRVMTVHRSKGLGFDLVILPDLQGVTGLTAPRLDGLAVEPGPPGSGPAWILDLPPRPIAQADPVLAGHLERAVTEACTAELYVLYVALTRAKRALHLLVPPPPAKGEAVHLATVLTATLAGEAPAPRSDPTEPNARLLFGSGTPDWFLERPLPEPAAPPTAAPVPRPAAPAAEPARRRHRQRLPSRTGEEAARLDDRLRSPTREGREFGAAMHALFRQVEWLDAEPLERTVERWRADSAIPREVGAAALTVFRRAVREPAVRAELVRPAAGPLDLWRETSFEVILDGEWVSGAFDRVTVTRAAAGQATAAALVDIKTDRVRDEADLAAAVERHAPQLHLYRRVVAHLLGIPPATVRACLIFTHPARVVEV